MTYSRRSITAPQTPDGLGQDPRDASENRASVTPGDGRATIPRRFIPPDRLPHPEIADGKMALPWQRDFQDRSSLVQGDQAERTMHSNNLHLVLRKDRRRSDRAARRPPPGFTIQ
jgi:peptidoglycan hydrolase-like protein with peptidoglycan-binding domain